MSYKELYKFCQQQSIPVSRKIIADKALELTNRPPIKLWRADMDINRLRGFYLSADNVDHQFVRQCKGQSIVVTARGLNNCWERFVVTKELMHLFDNPLESAGTTRDLDDLLALFTSEPLSRTAPMTSEIRAFWMALACLCPEHIRQDFDRKLNTGEVTVSAIAKALLIPEQYVPQLFVPQFKQMMSKLTESA